MAGAGASLITVHGRTRDKVYAGEVNFAEIEKVKKAVDIPVIANGGVFSVAEGEKLLAETGADGVMIARAALFDPQLFCDFTGKQRRNLYEFFVEQADETRALYGEKFATVFMRKMAAFYVKGMRGAAAYKDRLFAAKSVEEAKAIAKEVWGE